MRRSIPQTVSLAVLAGVGLLAMDARSEELLGRTGGQVQRNSAAVRPVHAALRNAAERFHRLGHGAVVRLLNRDWLNFVSPVPLDLQRVQGSGYSRDALQHEASGWAPALYRLLQTNPSAFRQVSPKTQQVIFGLGQRLQLDKAQVYAPPEPLWTPDLSNAHALQKLTKRTQRHERRWAPWLRQFVTETAQVTLAEWQEMLLIVHQADEEHNRFGDSEAQQDYGALRIAGKSGDTNFVTASNLPTPAQIGFASVPLGGARPNYSYYHGAQMTEYAPTVVTRVAGGRGVQIAFFPLRGLRVAESDTRFAALAQARQDRLRQAGVNGGVLTRLEGDGESPAWWLGTIATVGTPGPASNSWRFLDAPQIYPDAAPRYGLFLPDEVYGFLRRLYRELPRP